MTGAALMEALFQDIAHGDTAHRFWLKARLDAWAPRVADATEVAVIREAAECVLDCADRHPDRLECCYAMDAMLRAALIGSDAGLGLAAALAEAKKELTDYKKRVTDLLHMDMTRTVDPGFVQLCAKVDELRAALKLYEPYQNKCSCGLVCSKPTLLGHLRDCPDHHDASPTRLADQR